MNYLHWMMYGQRFWYYPVKGWLRTAFTVCNVLPLVCAPLVFFGIMPLVWYFGCALGWAAAMEFYCIRRRRKAITGPRPTFPTG